MAFQYSDNEDFSKILDNAHEAFKSRFKRLDDSKNAAELEKILTEIKKTARSFSNKRDPVEQELYSQYEELINIATSLQNKNRKRNLSKSTLFSRVHGTAVSTTANDIFEEDLAAVLAAAQIMNDKESNVDMEIFLFGAKSANTRALNNINLQTVLERTPINLINKMAERAGSRYRAKQLNVTTGKIDVKGYSKTLEISKDLPFNIQRLMELMKDATFTAKNYKTFRKNGRISLDELNLHLGNTNLYKAITGALSEIGAGHKQQQSFFYRGANTYLGNVHELGEKVATHFGHMRIIYELRGSGLLDESGHVSTAKYLIYNDPTSDAVFVKDTASLLYELIDSNTSKLFGGIEVKAIQAKSNKT